MNKPIEITFRFFDEEYKARFWKSEYANNGNLYIGVVYWDEEDECWMPWGDLTVNLDMKCRPNEAFLDTNNCAPEIIQILSAKGYIEDTGTVRPSGFCIYPLVKFSEKFLNGMFEDEEEGRSNGYDK